MTFTTQVKNMATIMGLVHLSPSEQEIFVDEFGEMALETTLVRLVHVLTSEQVAALTEFVETKPEPHILLGHIFTHYSDAESILKEVITEIQEDARDVLR